MGNNMYKLLIIVLLLTGVACVHSSVEYENGLRIRTVGETNMFRPSISYMEISECKIRQHCTFLEAIHGTQSGALTGLGNAAITGGAIAGTGYLIGDGIRDSGDRTTIDQSQGQSQYQSSKNLSYNKNYNNNYNKKRY